MNMARERKGWLGTHNDTIEAEIQMATLCIGYVISPHKLLSLCRCKGKGGELGA